jgi:hypothetical protein
MHETPWTGDKVLEFHFVQFLHGVVYRREQTGLAEEKSSVYWLISPRDVQPQILQSLEQLPLQLETPSDPAEVVLHLVRTRRKLSGGTKNCVYSEP